MFDVDPLVIMLLNNFLNELKQEAFTDTSTIAFKDINLCKL